MGKLSIKPEGERLGRRQVAMDTMIDSGNHAALAFKAYLGRDVTTDLKQFAVRYLKRIAPAQVDPIELAPAMTQSLRH